ncbi:MAG: hypothetical protein IJ417_04670 [Bacteroidaceae bacterium]|nr:hypothetical protein [Bacteroidaceae bacterium]
MKYSRIFNITVLFLGVVSTTFAQDVLITQEGDSYKVYDIEIGSSSIFYKLTNAPETTIQKMDKSQVLMIKYQDGRKVIMGEEEKDQAAFPIQNEQQSPMNSMMFTPEEEAEIAALNAKLVEEYNQQKVGWTKPEDKKAKMLFCTFGLKKDTRLQDKHVKITLRTQTVDSKAIFYNDAHCFNPGILVVVENMSAKTVYVDLGNSFFVRNGEAAPYYIPSSTSTTTGTSGGASVNLGSVADAIGVGGLVGTLANGVNVGGGKSASSSTVTYAQRVVAIPPKSEIKLSSQGYFNQKSQYWKFKVESKYKMDKVTSSDFNLKRGETVCYTEKDETLSYGVRVAYSFEESCRQTNSLCADMYLKEILGVKGDGGTLFVDNEFLTPNWRNVLYMVASIK